MNRETKLLFAILAGAVAGLLSGWYFGSAMTAVGWIGKMFLDLLKMMIIPLVIAAVITGVTSLGDVRKIGRVGGFTVLYYSCTTGLAVFIGLVMVNIIRPGDGLEGAGQGLPEHISDREASGFTDILSSLVSPNLIDAAANTELLPIIVFCLIFAIALTTVGEKNKPLIRFFDGLNEVMMKLVVWLMYLAPIGIFALIADRLGQAGGGQEFIQELRSVGWYCVTVIAGLAIHFVLLFCILLTFSSYGRNYLFNLLRALLTAFGTASSSATLPVTIECAKEGGVDKRAVKFVLPIGVTMNMDGTALYEAVAVMFIAQALNISMGPTEQIIIFVTATLAAIGAAGIPQAGLVTMLIVLAAVDLPTEGIGLLLAVDWFLDRFRTTVNVWGDSVGAAIVEKYLPE